MLITKQTDLDKLCEHLAQEKVIAIDTEFVREKTYYPILSLIQLATSTQICVIDALVGLDLSTIKDILSAPSVLKIFHAAKQDIEVLYNHFKCVPLNIFDTQIAAQFTGFIDPPSYDKLVQKYCGVAISKQHQFSDWLRRPLSPSQLEYALGDVTYLIEMKNKLSDEINAKNMLTWLAEENKALENYTYKSPQAIDYFGKFLKSFKSTQALSQVYVLLKAREQQAEALNKPRNFILRDEPLIEIVKRKTLGEAMSKQLNLTEQEFIKQAENPALHSMVKEYVRRASTRLEVDIAKLEALKTLLVKKSQEHGISASLIANRNDLSQLVIGQTEGLRVLTGWRKLAFGDDSIKLLQTNR